MKRAQIQSVALFFFYAFLDERIALRATFRTIDELTNQFRKSPDLSDEEQQVALVAQTYKNWQHFGRSQHHLPTGGPTVEGWQLPQGLDLGPWRQFKKQAGSQELLSVIWSSILEISEDVIAEGLKVSSGTIRYRIGNGLKLLGTMTPLGAYRA